MKVMKFGGSTIKTPKMMKRAAEIIKNEEEKKAVVVSALFGQTNEIRGFLSGIETEGGRIDAFIAGIRKRHMAMTSKTISNKNIEKRVEVEVDRLLLRLERLLYGAAYTEELTPRTSDLILSSGERLSAQIMGGVLESMNVNAKAYEADSIGVLTDGVFGSATANLGATEKKMKKTLLPEIKSGTLPVITGFFGCDENGCTTTFGKNGSDYSAAVLAYALKAKKLELWKDVDGFMSADPGLAEKAYTIERLSYDEAAELAYFGISLLHPRTVGPVRLRDIPIVIKNIKRPKNDATTIGKKSYRAPNIVKSVVYTDDLVEVRVSGSGAGLRPGVLSHVSGALEKSKINIYSVSTSHTHLSMLIFRRDLPECLRALKRVSKGPIEQVESKKDIALVCVVGQGMRDSSGLAARIFSAVANAGVNVEGISAGASHVASHFLINKSDLEKTIRAIHSEFCESRTILR